MSIQFPKLGHYQLPSWEVPHYLRDPPKSVFTRKYEPVTEADTTWRLRNDESLISEHIQYIPRGVNPMVDVSFSNIGLAQQGTNGVQPSLPYKVGVVRPPMFKLKDLLPLSRMKHDNYGILANPGLAAESQNDLYNSVDRAPIKTAIDKIRGGYVIDSNVSDLQNFHIESVLGGESLLKLNNNLKVYPKSSIPSFVLPTYTDNAPKNIRDLNTYSLTSSINPVLKVYGQAPIDKTKVSLTTDVQTILSSELKLYSPDTSITESSTKDELHTSIDYIPAGIIFYNPETRDIQDIKVKDLRTASMEINKGSPIDIGTDKNGDPIKLRDYSWKEVTSAKGKIIQLQPITTEKKLLRDEKGNVLKYSFDTSRSTTTGTNILDVPDARLSKRLTNFGGFSGRENVSTNLPHPVSVLKHKKM